MAVGSPRFVHVVLPDDPHAAHALIQSLRQQGHTASGPRADYDERQLHELLTEGGFSSNPHNPYAPTKGFMVSVDKTTAKHHIDTITPEHIHAHRTQYRRHLSHPHTYQGGWHDKSTGDVYLDVSKHYGDEENARDEAAHQKQKAYFNLKTHDEMFMNPHQDPQKHEDPKGWSAKYAHVGTDAHPDFHSYAHLYPDQHGHTATWQHMKRTASTYTVRVEHGRRRPDAVTPEHGPVTPAYLEHPSAVTHVKVHIDTQHPDGRDKSDHEMDQEALHTAYQMAHETGGARGHDMVTKTDIIHLEAALQPDVKFTDLGREPVDHGTEKHLRKFHEEIHEDGSMKTLPIEHVHPGQEIVDRDDDHVRDPERDADKPPVGIRLPNGHYQLMDGHHRFADALARGDSHFTLKTMTHGHGKCQADKVPGSVCPFDWFMEDANKRMSKTAHYDDPDWRPHARIFGPGESGEDPRLFDGDHLKSQVREDLLGTLGEYWQPKYGQDWENWAKVYFTGSEASHWYGNNDFDVLIGVDYTKFKEATGSRLHDEEIDDLLNQGFRADMNGPCWFLVPDSSTWHPDHDSMANAYDKSSSGGEPGRRPPFLHASSTSPSPLSVDTWNSPESPEWLGRQALVPTDAQAAVERGQSAADVVPAQPGTCVSDTFDSPSDSPSPTTNPLSSSKAAAAQSVSNSGPSWWTTIMGAVLGSARAADVSEDSSASTATSPSDSSASTSSDEQPITSKPPYPAPPGMKWEGPFDRTWYVNNRSYDIRRLKPYAAYNVSDDEWSVRPVTVPKDWGPDKFPEATWRMAEHYANEIDRISKLTPASVQQHYAQVLFEHIHTDRQRAFSERGTGVFDVGNVAEKYLDQRPDHPLAMLVEMKNQETSGVAKTAHMTDEEFDHAWAPEQGSMEGYKPPGKRHLTDEAFRLKRHIETLKEDEDWGGYPGEEKHARENGYKRTNYVEFGKTASSDVPLYHGTIADESGDLPEHIHPGWHPNWANESEPGHVYLTPNRKDAEDYAQRVHQGRGEHWSRPVVHEVRPTGPVEADPTHHPDGTSRGNYSDDLRSKHPLEVVDTHEVEHPWGADHPWHCQHCGSPDHDNEDCENKHMGAKKKIYEHPTVSGIALRAADTGRLLMIQRSNNDESDPAKGTWEFPGGHHEDGDHTSLHAGIREWEEEVGQKFPKDGAVVHTWRTGPYQGHMVVIPEEKSLDLSKSRAKINPDDPDCDDHEQAAWWEPEHARKNPALRQECKDNWKDIVPGLKHIEAGYENNEAHSDETGHLVNPVDGSRDWHHGTPHSFKHFGEEHDEEADWGEDDPYHHDSRHWNTYMGTHWTSRSDTADTFAKGLHHNSYTGPKGAPGEVHTANLGIKSPVHFHREEDMDDEAFEHHWEHGRHDREDPQDHHGNVCDCGGDVSTCDDPSAVEHVKGEYKSQGSYYLFHHRHKQEIAEDYRDHLKSKGHDGVTYGNSDLNEGPIGHTCAITFDHDQIHNHRIRPGKFGYKTASADDGYTYKHVVHQPKFGAARYGQEIEHPHPEDVYHEGASKAFGGAHMFEHQIHHKGMPVAKLRYSMHPEEPHVLNIEGIAVHPHHQGKGLAFQLVDKMQEHARHIGGQIDHGTYTDQGHAFSRKYMKTEHHDPSLHLPYPEHPTATKGHEFLPHMLDPEEITHGYTASLSGADRWHEHVRSGSLGDGWYHDEDDAQHNLEHTGSYHPSNGRVHPAYHSGIQRTGALDGVPISDSEQEDRLAPGTFKEQSKPQAEPSGHVVEGARAYCGPRGLGDPHDIDYSTVKTTADKTRSLGRAYHSLPDHDPDAVPHFEAMRKEIHSQYEHMTGHMGIKVHMVDHDPYTNSKEMMHDVHHNKTIKVLRTAKTGGHPYFSDDENDKFRAVHDVFGHAATGRGFDKHGEEAAYTAHSKMFSPMARPAMETETRGQNHFYNLNGRFAKQKVAILGKVTGTYHPETQQHGVTARLLDPVDVLV